ncbi:alpha-amylase, partial [Alphaproteobacteria bacterium]|nr:alpha-amylase [Alphaproteobacteria bacterium]
GMRPTEGLMSDAEREKMLHQLKENGGLFSWRTTENEKKRVYEANITLYNALEKTPDDQQGTLKIPRLIAAHALIFGLEGIPALYINSLIGAENDTLGVKKSGINRRINRKKFEFEKISAVLANPLSKESLIIEQLKELLQIRKLQPAFHPNATQFTLQLGSYFFGIWRQSRDRTQSIFAITNLSASSLHLSLSEINLIDTEDWSDLITKKSIDSRLRYLEMNPYQTVWITNLSIV